ncbi:hypothetical protein [Lentilactobacillus kisonensis]|uniref:S-layer protein n=1 Tax=Lentilactobacillus kisonensis DSM 19906 = JCM 15041 TaxID=1423766 RepID=A0A0R1NQK0_9LACO|nr:hypothetical protein [Lentilactobacillus kisonensis]KRL22663.1 S-layer protein [Lentilactobacillus kisonensis DSM 19906 = JCM 15041]
MKISIKKSLFVGLAALGFVAAAGAANANTASAKTYAKVVSNKKLSTNATDRNVNFTGTSALYTKAGTLKGARVKASKTTLNGLASATTSKSNVRAYRVATTNRGSVYYKVVTFDGQYRGWIYGGKSANAFAGGVKSYSTTTDPTPATASTTSNSSSASSTTTPSNQNTGLTDAQKSATYKIATTGTANDGTQVTYTTPAWTQYKQGRVMTDSSKYKDATFKIADQTTRTREGDLWVKITATDSANSAANGWIKFSGLTTGTTPTDNFDANKSVKIAYRDVTTGKTIDKTNAWTTASANTKQGDATTNNVDNSGRSLTSYLSSVAAPSGYSYKLSSGTTVNPDLSNLTITPAATTAKFGDTLTVDVTPNAKATKVQYYYESAANGSIKPMSASDFAHGFPALTTDQQNSAFPSTTDSSDSFNVADYFGDTKTTNKFETALNAADNAHVAKAGSLTSPGTNKKTGNDHTGFFGTSFNNGNSRYFYVFNSKDTLDNNTPKQSKGATVKVVMQQFETNTQLPDKVNNQNGNTDYIAK